MHTKFLTAIAFFGTILLLSASCKKSNNSNGGGGSGGNTNPSNVSIATFSGTGNNTFPYAPSGICSDAQGNIYVSLPGNETILKLSATGVPSLFAGSALNPGCEAGTGSSATFTEPIEICTDPGGNIYVADYVCSGIKKISSSGTSTLFAQSDPYNNVFLGPQAICSDPNGNIYSANQLGEEGIIKTTPDGKPVRFAGADTTGYVDGPAVSAEFFSPVSICADGSGNIYVADAHRIRKIANGQVTTLAGNQSPGYADGKGSAAQFGGSMGICLDSHGNIFVADTYNDLIRKVTPDGTVTTVAGDGNEGEKDGNGLTAEFDTPVNVCFDPQGNLYVTDYGPSGLSGGTVRKLTFK